MFSPLEISRPSDGPRLATLGGGAPTLCFLGKAAPAPRCKIDAFGELADPASTLATSTGAQTRRWQNVAKTTMVGAPPPSVARHGPVRSTGYQVDR